MKMSEQEAALRKCINQIFSSWEGLFDYSLEHDDSYDEWQNYWIEIHVSHPARRVTYAISVRVNDEGDCEIDMSEDCYYDLSSANLFAYMWLCEIGRDE